MKDEIKAILIQDGEPTPNNPVEIKRLLVNKEAEDYITNLQEELEDLREDNYAYHQLMKMQNKREYRSKFLKEFQEEFGTNTFPDYDEIYKRYDKVKKENERLKKDIKFYEYSFNKFKERFEKGTEYIKSTKYCGTKIDKISLEEYLNKLLNILNGGDE